MSGATPEAHRVTLPQSRMRESRRSGSVREAPGDRRLYSTKSTATVILDYRFRYTGGARRAREEVGDPLAVEFPDLERDYRVSASP